MRTINAMAAAGGTDAGLQREVNEDRFHIDQARGLFIVIDGVGGQAAGGKAADVALGMLRERLERETGPVVERVREAITIANNEIYRLASTRPEWDGMACVLTIAVVKDGAATIGHVGDTRLYMLRDGQIEKITSDHSPVGEREDALEISELEAMRHPRRNEVYRDVGSEPHSAGDPEFVEIHEIPFDSDDALLLCSDGLTDLVDSGSILRTVREWAGDPAAVVRALVNAANAEGGKDNVTAVYIEGGTFTTARSSGSLGSQSHVAETASREASQSSPPESPSAQSHSGALFYSGSSTIRRLFAAGAVMVVALVITSFMAYRTAVLLSLLEEPTVEAASPNQPAQTVRPGESIAAALSRAQPGSEVVVEPGEYRERVTLTNNIRLVSRVRRGATIRLPATASDAQPEPAVIATGSSSAELVGFRIVGDARTPLGVGVLVAGSGLSLVDVEVSGATTAAITFARDSTATLLGSDIHDNPGAGLVIQAGATPRITHNVFSRNGLSQHTPASFSIERGAVPFFQRNVFLGMRPHVFELLDDAARVRLLAENWFLSAVSANDRAEGPGEGGTALRR